MIMAVLHLSLLFSTAILLLHSTVSLGQDITCTVTVDSLAADNSNCLSGQQLLSTNRSESENCTSVCRTINDALGNVPCNYNCSTTEENRLNGVRILLADGVHRLTGEKKALYGNTDKKHFSTRFRCCSFCVSL